MADNEMVDDRYLCTQTHEASEKVCAGSDIARRRRQSLTLYVYVSFE